MWLSAGSHGHFKRKCAHSSLCSLDNGAAHTVSTVLRDDAAALSRGPGRPQVLGCGAVFLSHGAWGYHVSSSPYSLTQLRRMFRSLDSHKQRVLTYSPPLCRGGSCPPQLSLTGPLTSRLWIPGIQCCLSNEVDCPCQPEHCPPRGFLCQRPLVS